MIKLGNKEVIPNGLSKVMKGDCLVWENIKKVSWNIESLVSSSDAYVDMPKNLFSELKGKRIISLKIENYKEIDGQNIESISSSGFLIMKEAFYNYLDDFGGAPAGTKITVTYK